MMTEETTSTQAPEIDLDELMERIRGEVAERKKHSGAAVPTPGDRLPDYAGRRWTAGEILRLPSPEFARAAYLAFLGREPTPDEFVRLRDRLLIEHVGRMRILREFRASPAAHGRLDGFWRESAKDRLYWSPPAKFGRSLIRLIVNIYHGPRWFREITSHVESLEKRTTESAAAIRGIRSQQATDRQNATKQVTQTRDQLAATKDALDQAIANRAGTLENRISKERFEIETRLSEMALKLAETRTDHWRAILDQKLRMEAFLETERKTGGLQEDVRVEPELSHLLDPLYLSFEDRYRGTRDDIKSRQGVYLDKIMECAAVTGRGTIIDIGCGRGEWLELLAQSGITARGYDLNRIAVEECRARGLDVILADAIDALASLPEESCSAITAFHIIEHLPFEILVKLIDHSLRVLRPGGLLIVETPNPANLVVAAEKFYFDPTHRNPLPSELTSYLLESRGFGEVRVVPLHPVSSVPQRDYEDPMLAYLQDKLFGPQDYAAIALKSS